MFGFYVTYQGIESYTSALTTLTRDSIYPVHGVLKDFCRPLRATPLRRMAVMALFISSLVSKAELTCTTSKSTGTQLNLQHDDKQTWRLDCIYVPVNTFEQNVKETNLKTSLT